MVIEGKIFSSVKFSSGLTRVKEVLLMVKYPTSLLVMSQTYSENAHSWRAGKSKNLQEVPGTPVVISQKTHHRDGGE